MGVIHMQDVENQEGPLDRAARNDINSDVASENMNGDGVNNKKATKGGERSSKRKNIGLLALVAVLLVAIIVCAITIPLVVRNRNDNDESSSSAEAAKNDDSNHADHDDDDPAPAKNNNGTTVVGGNATTGNTTAGSTSPNNRTNDTVFQTSQGLFEANLEVMSPGVARGYSTDDELAESIGNATNFYLGIIYDGIVKNSGTPAVTNGDASSGGQENLATSDDGPSGSAQKSPSGSSFDTNNQEQGVEEGDVLVSDGNYVYAAYGKYLVVWSTATGSIVKSFEMPPVDMNTTNSDGDVSASSEKISSSSWIPEPFISSLLLHEGRLLVIVGGYDAAYYPDYSDPSGEIKYSHVLSSYLGTSIRLYDTAALVATTANATVESGLIASKFVNGAWNAVRAVNGIAHVVTMSGLNNDGYLLNPMQRLAVNTSGSEMEQEVERALPSIRSGYTTQLMNDLRAGGDSVPRLTRINSWQTSHSENGRLEEINYSSGLMSSLVLIHSLDMTSRTLGSELVTTSSGSFVPAYWVQVYGSDTKIILAANVYEYDDATMSSKESTGLLAFDIAGTSATPTSVGTVSGYLLNSYAMDVVGNILRLATTVRNQTWVADETILSADADGGMSEPAQAEDPAVSETSVVSSDMMIDPMPTFEFETENFIILMNMPTSNGSDGEPASMVEVGRVQIGKPQEVITSIRFLDNITYAVTFERTDPFYVLDLSNPAQPVILGELNITGFSSYLHPINPEQTLLLAVGEDADIEGTPLGLQITLFDATDPRKPIALHRYNVEKDNNTYSYSDSQWDYKAFRYFDGYLYLPVDIGANWNMDGTTTQQQQPFYGTMIFKIDKNTGIEEVVPCRVAHTNENIYEIMPVSDESSVSDGDSTLPRRPCTYSSYLPRRSMLFDGDLMSIRNSEIIMTDLETCTRMWNTTIAIASDNCAY